MPVTMMREKHTESKKKNENVKIKKIKMFIILTNSPTFILHSCGDVGSIPQYPTLFPGGHLSTPKFSKKSSMVMTLWNSSKGSTRNHSVKGTFFCKRRIKEE